MSEFAGYLQRLRDELGVDPKRADEICAEVRTHLEARAAQLQESGLGPDDAAAEAVASFGDPTEIAQRLMRANRRHRSFSALRIFVSLALSGGVLFVVIGGLSDAYRPLSEWLLQSRALGKYAWMLAVVIVVGSAVHAILIDGTMETISKIALCALVLIATTKVVVDRKVWARRTASGS